MNNLKLWAHAISPRNNTVFANYFWIGLEPKWMNSRNRSPWAKRETQKDWSIDDLFQALNEIGLEHLSGGGNCPVQIEGNLPNGQELYFRARGQDWYCEIEDAGLYNEGTYGQELYAAGYMPLSEVFKRIEASLKKWRKV